MISRKKSLFLSVSVLILFVALVAQSCSSENDDFVANPNSSWENHINWQMVRKVQQTRPIHVNESPMN